MSNLCDSLLGTWLLNEDTGDRYVNIDSYTFELEGFSTLTCHQNVGNYNRSYVMKVDTTCESWYVNSVYANV